MAQSENMGAVHCGCANRYLSLFLMPDYITPKISIEQAREILQSPPGLLKKKRFLNKLELFHLPSYIIDVQISTSKEQKTQSLCVDAVLGSFAFFESAESSSTPPLYFKTCPFFLSDDTVQQKAVEEYRRYLLRSGLKMRFKFQVEQVLDSHPVYYPFWIGYFKRKGKIDFDVIDAVAGVHQGALMRPVFIKALLGETETT